MKLLYCKNCQDVIKLDYTHRVCACGRASGKYLPDGLNAVISGDDAILLGFANSSLVHALANHEANPGPQKLGWTFEAFIIPEPCPTVNRIKL